MVLGFFFDITISLITAHFIHKILKKQVSSFVVFFFFLSSKLLKQSKMSL